jgi:hypothetical protein
MKYYTSETEFNPPSLRKLRRASCLPDRCLSAVALSEADMCV